MSPRCSARRYRCRAAGEPYCNVVGATHVHTDVEGPLRRERVRRSTSRVHAHSYARWQATATLVSGTADLPEPRRRSGVASTPAPVRAPPAPPRVRGPGTGRSTAVPCDRRHRGRNVGPRVFDEGPSHGRRTCRGPRRRSLARTRRRSVVRRAGASRRPARLRPRRCRRALGSRARLGNEPSAAARSSASVRPPPASASTSASPIAWATMPSTFSPRRRRRRAHDDPTRATSAPVSAGPSRESAPRWGVENRAVGSVTIRSHASRSSTPPPIVRPLASPTVGNGAPRNRCSKRAMSAWNARRTAPSMRCTSSWSPPRQKSSDSESSTAAPAPACSSAVELSAIDRTAAAIQHRAVRGRGHRDDPDVGCPHVSGAELVATDDQPHDLRGALPVHECSAVAEVPLDRGLGGVPDAAVQLRGVCRDRARVSDTCRASRPPTRRRTVARRLRPTSPSVR